MKPVWIAKRTSADLIRQVCPLRAPDSHKGDYGRLLLICGAEGYTGAPYLAAQAALRTGAGLIFTGVPRSVYPIVASKLHAPMVFPLADTDGKLSMQALPQILERLRAVDACLLGPGLGRSEELDALVCEIVRHCRCPLVLDADGINAAAAHKDVLREAACPIVLTPHEGEFRRLTSAEEPDRISGAKALAKELGAIVLRKGHETIVTDGERSYVNRTGNAGMATGGSGDVLAGILTALLGQGAGPLKAAAAAAWLHGMAGDLAAMELGQYALTPTDLIGQLSRLLP
ncbi:MAG: NAD(P)H-hydrate dehydratase [Oscillospiraceae bacterium]|nr:NAD(P)H-hydrate dehydratase [Oscillospiraceae bacterium]